ncbi:MAG: type I toxin-antitoxin system SymE family toxin [Anaerolineales bacterium]|nr:type I toxin-antitoxin system SymE family toxin [Anaerolineales bacterium]
MAAAVQRGQGGGVRGAAVGKQRSLTIGETADAYLLRQGRETSRPSIRLRGKWLAQAGFEAGQMVTVHVEDGQIVITPKDFESCQAE